MRTEEEKAAEQAEAAKRADKVIAAVKEIVLKEFFGGRDVNAIAASILAHTDADTAREIAAELTRLTAKTVMVKVEPAVDHEPKIVTVKVESVEVKPKTVMVKVEPVEVKPKKPWRPPPERSAAEKEAVRKVWNRHAEAMAASGKPKAKVKKVKKEVEKVEVAAN